jgi:hypothetical protein
MRVCMRAAVERDKLSSRSKGGGGGIWRKLFECAQSIQHGEDVDLRGVGAKD